MRTLTEIAVCLLPDGKKIKLIFILLLQIGARVYFYFAGDGLNLKIVLRGLRAVWISRA